MSIKSASESIEGIVTGDIDIGIFDGHSIKSVKVSDGKFKSPHRATAGLYEVLFFTRNGYYPKVVAIKAGEKTKTVKIEPLKKMRDPRKGVLAGVVYKPVSGGKLIEHSGIAELFEGEKISVIGKGTSFAAMTDAKGFFMIELPEGEYDIAPGADKTDKVSIEPGKTVIKNIQKGIILY